MSALQESLAKRFAEIRSKSVPSLSWCGVVRETANEPGETYMRAICCRRQLCTAKTVVLEQNTGTFVRSSSPGSKNVCGEFRQFISKSKLNISYYEIN
jgi:hypothetical protein